MAENSSNERVKINNKIGPGAEGGDRDRGMKRVQRGLPLCVNSDAHCARRVGVLVWIGGPGAVIAARNVSPVRGCALTTGCHCPCALQRQNSGVTDHN